MKLQSYADGYTLLELLIVLAVLALIAGLAGALTGAFGPRRELAALQAQTTEALIDARAKAVSQGRSIVISVAADGRSLIHDGIPVVMADHIRLSAPIVFDADGLSNGGTVVLEFAGEHSAIAIEPLTGRLHKPGAP